MDRFVLLGFELVGELRGDLLVVKITVQVETGRIERKLSVTCKGGDKARLVAQGEDFAFSSEFKVSALGVVFEFAEKLLPSGDDDAAVLDDLLIPVGEFTRACLLIGDATQ